MAEDNTEVLGGIAKKEEACGGTRSWEVPFGMV